MSVVKGQNLRVFIGDKCVAAATSCTLHIGTTLEESSSKDDTNSWKKQSCTSKNWDMSVDALVVDTDTTGETAWTLLKKVGTEVTLKYQETEGEQNRVVKAEGECVTGNAIVADYTQTAANKANGTYSVSFTGNGPLE